MMKVSHRTVAFKKKYLLAAGILCYTSSGTFAVDNIVKLDGMIDAQAIYYKNKGDPSQQKLSEYQKYFGFHSSGHFALDYQLVTDEDVKYGTKISVTQTAKNDRTVPLVLYLESNFGRIEAGSDKTANQKMKLTAYSSSCATGNGWDAYMISSPKDSKGNSIVPYITSFCSFLDARTRTSKLSDYARKITYYTPKFGTDIHKFQIGISYTPDTSNAGHSKLNEQNLHTPVPASAYKFVIKDGVSYGITYEGKFSNLLSAKLAFVGEIGQPIAFEKEVKSETNFKKLNTYNIGTEVTYDQLSVAASYMNYNKSLTNPTVDKLGLNTSIYDGGMKYKFCAGKYAASLNHLHSEHKKNKLDATSIGLDYFVSSGIKTYAQVTYYKTNGRFLENGNIKSDKSKGAIAIIGAKIAL